MGTDGRSVGARVRAARRWLLAARLAESVLLAAAAFLGVMAATALSGGSPTALEALAVAGLGALLAGLAHALFHKESLARIARRLDAALAMDGALLTAFEVEGDASPSTLARLLPMRVAARVPARTATRTLLPRSMPLVVLPFLAGAALFLSLDLRHRRDPRRELEAHAERISGAAGRLRAAMGGRDEELTESEREQGIAIAEQAAALRNAHRSGASEPETARAALEDLREQAAELAAGLPAESAAREELRELEADAEAALRALGPEDRPAARAAGEAEPAAVGTGEQGGREAQGGSGLTPGDPEGRMRDRPSSGELSGAPAPAASGLAGRRPLPASHARIVSGWIEGRAARAAAPTPH